jgi:hypothetical protein
VWIFKIEIEPPSIENDEFGGEFTDPARKYYVHVIAHSINEALLVAKDSGRNPMWRDRSCEYARIHPALYKHEGPLLISDRAKQCKVMYKHIADITGQKFKESNNRTRLN